MASMMTMQASHHMRGLENQRVRMALSNIASHHMRGLEIKFAKLTLFYQASHHMRGLETIP